ncbi:hypothetical protein PM082_004544 [Marasmius tenuissimus]|nr:hypothetical protein PM082_004544 [Marasmius tenuissimus]
MDTDSPGHSPADSQTTSTTGNNNGNSNKGKQRALAPMPSLPRMDLDTPPDDGTSVYSDRAPTLPPALQPDTSSTVVSASILASSSVKKRVTRSSSKKDLAAPSEEGCSSTSKAVTTARNKSKKDPSTSNNDTTVASLLSRVATVEDSIAVIRQQLLDMHSSYDSNHVALLWMIAELKPSEPINIDVVDRLEELWNMLAETRGSIQTLSSSLGTMLPREECERRLPHVRDASQSSPTLATTSSTCLPMPSVPTVQPLPVSPPVPLPAVARASTPGPSCGIPPLPSRPAPPSASYLSSVVPSNLVAAPSGLSLSVSKGKRAVESDDSSSSKCTKQDVAYVELGFTPSTDNPLHIAHYVAGRLHSDQQMYSSDHS